MNTENLLNIEAFCETETNLRYALDKPFVQDGWLYARDGHAIVRVPAEGDPNTDPGDKRLPNCQNIFRLYPQEVGEWKPWPEVGEVEMRERYCLTCDGTGFVHRKECSECDGDGEITCDSCGQDCECKQCGGEGFIGCGKCLSCKGAKKYPQPLCFAIDSLKVSLVNDAKVRALPGVEYQIADAVFFIRFQGGQGIVMPVV